MSWESIITLIVTVIIAIPTIITAGRKVRIAVSIALVLIFAYILVDYLRGNVPNKGKDNANNKEIGCISDTGLSYYEAGKAKYEKGEFKASIQELKSSLDQSFNKDKCKDGEELAIKNEIHYLLGSAYLKLSEPYCQPAGREFIAITEDSEQKKRLFRELKVNNCPGYSQATRVEDFRKSLKD